MRRCMVFYLVVLIGLAATAQTLNLQGVVSNTSGQPIADAVVTLVGQNMSDTTAADGSFGFATTALKLRSIVPKTGNISMDNGVVRFNLSQPAPLKVELFDVHGKLIKKGVFNNTPAGIFTFAIANVYSTTNLLVIKAAIGSHVATFRYMTLTGSSYMLHQASAPATTVQGLAKEASADEIIDDTIRVTAESRLKAWL